MTLPRHARVLLRPAAVSLGVFFFILAGSQDDCAATVCFQHQVTEAILPALLFGLFVLAVELLRLLLARRKGR